VNSLDGLFIAIIKALLRAGIRIAAVLAAFFVLTGFHFTPAGIAHAVQTSWRYALLFAGLGFTLDAIFRSDRALWRYVSIVDIFPIVRTSTVSVLLFLLAAFVAGRAVGLPRSILFLTWVFDISLTLALLLVRRFAHDREALRVVAPFFSGPDMRRPVVLVGRMDRAEGFLRDISLSSTHYRAVAVLADSFGRDGRELRGVKILSDFEHAVQMLEDMAVRHQKPAVVFLDDGVRGAGFSAGHIGHLRGLGVSFLRMPRLEEVNSAVGRGSLREIKFEELLSRPPVSLDASELTALVSGRRILVTGAGGSIGSEICRQVAGLGCSHLTLVDHSEFGLFSIDIEIGDRWPTLSRSEILCDIRNRSQVQAIFDRERPDIVFHAAALKHVPLMERHPCESVLTNVVGTWNVTDAASAHGVRQMVFVSTDKAVDPTNVMGATKRLAESVVRAQQTPGNPTRFSVVRFGNVLGSAGSVVPTFRAQIERGGPVTVTHPDIERFFMTIPEAVQLVLHATARAANSSEGPLGVFVLDMGAPVKIIDLARQLIELYGKVPDRDIHIEITGLRPGEKLFEELIDVTEQGTTSEAGVIKVTDRNLSERMTRQTVDKLEALARSGDAEAVRKLVFEILERVRGVHMAEAGQVVSLPRK